MNDHVKSFLNAKRTDFCLRFLPDQSDGCLERTAVHELLLKTCRFLLVVEQYGSVNLHAGVFPVF